MPPQRTAARTLGSGGRRTHRREAVPNVATHYEILGVSRSATTDGIRRAYHAEARRWHPDRATARAPGDVGRADDAMRRVNEAWRVLGDPDRRRTYDRFLEVGVGAPTGGAATTGAPGPVGGPAYGVRIDPRLLDPEYLAARRRAGEEDIGRTHSVVLRMAPWVAVLGLLAVIFVFTAYARPQPEEAVVPTTVPGPPIGVDAGACVRIATGPSLLEVPCDGVRDGYVIGVKLDRDQACPALSRREVALPNGAIVCLAP